MIEINGRSTVDIPHQQAINYIKQGGQTVRLLLKSGDGSVPEIGKFMQKNCFKVCDVYNFARFIFYDVETLEKLVDQ